MDILFGLVGLWFLYKFLVGFRFAILGLRKLRFTLQSMMTLVVIGGACGALLSDPNNHLVFGLGIACSLVAVGFLSSYLIILGMFEGSTRKIVPGTTKFIEDLDFRPTGGIANGEIAAETEAPADQRRAKIRILSGEK